MAANSYMLDSVCYFFGIPSLIRQHGQTPRSQRRRCNPAAESRRATGNRYQLPRSSRRATRSSGVAAATLLTPISRRRSDSVAAFCGPSAEPAAPTLFHNDGRVSPLSPGQADGSDTSADCRIMRRAADHAGPSRASAYSHFHGGRIMRWIALMLLLCGGCKAGASVIIDKPAGSEPVGRVVFSVST